MFLRDDEISRVWSNCHIPFWDAISPTLGQGFCSTGTRQINKAMRRLRSCSEIVDKGVINVGEKLIANETFLRGCAKYPCWA